VRRLLLIRHAATAATRASAFPLDEALDERARADASRLAAALPSRADALTSPARRCRETAAAAGLDATVDEGLAACDFGAWAGRTLEEVHEREPEVVRDWMLDPAAAPHGGESLAAVLARVGRWLDVQAQAGGRAVAITHAEIVKAAVVHALAAPALAFWRIDAAPLAVTELHGQDGRWTVVRLNERVTGAPARAQAASGTV
jgi:broad specificity phosphatase PhoE